jgi:hypothetical protein
MDIERVVVALVISADRNFLGLPNFQDSQNNSEKPPKILDSTLQKYAPVFALRCTALAWEYAYDSYLKKHSELSLTTAPLSYDTFQYRCITNFENHNLYREALSYVSGVLPEKISLEYVGLAQEGGKR